MENVISATLARRCVAWTLAQGRKSNHPRDRFIEAWWSSQIMLEGMTCAPEMAIDEPERSSYSQAHQWTVV
jgi:hypothetical protein